MRQDSNLTNKKILKTMSSTRRPACYNKIAECELVALEDKIHHQHERSKDTARHMFGKMRATATGTVRRRRRANTTVKWLQSSDAPTTDNGNWMRKCHLSLLLRITKLLVYLKFKISLFSIRRYILAKKSPSTPQALEGKEAAG